MGTQVVAKKAKLADNGTNNTPTNCAHWVQRKKRYCKMSVKAGQSYCGEHMPQTADAQPTNECEESTRIPCPLDAKHTVYKKNLQKHLKVCNARPKDGTPAYIVKNVNAGDAMDKVTEDYSNIRLHELADDEFYSVIDKVKALHAKHIAGQIKELHAQHKLLDGELAKADYGPESRKHLLQASALLGILEQEKQLQNSTSFIEFGAGKGQLAYYLAQLLEEQQNSQVVLLDRMSLRHKKDNKIEDRTLVQRIRADIADFKMSALELLSNSKRVVAVSKHLCGAATDLTLRCITQEKSEGKVQVEFILIALCCHHRCDWRSYVGKEYCQQHGITPREFVIITKMVSWAICGTGMSRERRRVLEEQALSPKEVHDNQSKQRLSLAEREQIGFMCKRVLDYGRLEYLRKKGYETALKYYVPREVTLENVCLLAKRLNGANAVCVDASDAT